MFIVQRFSMAAYLLVWLLRYVNIIIVVIITTTIIIIIIIISVTVIIINRLLISIALLYAFRILYQKTSRCLMRLEDFPPPRHHR